LKRTIPSCLLKGCGFFSTRLPDLELAWRRQGQFLQPGLGKTKQKTIAGRLVPNSPVLSVPAIVWVSDPAALPFLWTSRALLAPRRCPMPPAAAAPGAMAGGSPGEAAQPLRSKAQSHVRLVKTNERKGKAILLLTARAAGLCWFHARRQCSRSTSRQAQPGLGALTRSRCVTGLPVTNSHRPVAGRATHVTGRYRNRTGSQPGEQPAHGASPWLAQDSPLQSCTKLSQLVFSFLPPN